MSNQIPIIRKGFPGIPPDFWKANNAVISRLIKQHALKPALDEQLQNMLHIAPLKLEGKIRPKYLINGGLKDLHLHYNDDVFLLNQVQWNEFSSHVIEGFKARLSKVNSIGINELMTLSDAMESIT